MDPGIELIETTEMTAETVPEIVMKAEVDRQNEETGIETFQILTTLLGPMRITTTQLDLILDRMDQMVISLPATTELKVRTILITF